MGSKSTKALLSIICLVWGGMVLGISFLEAPVKFTTPSLTLAVGLDIGRHVFGVFNLVEIGWTLASIVLAILALRALSRGVLVALAAIWIGVLLESVWLLPVMDARIELILAGAPPPSSYHHVVYIALDVLKVILLLGAGMYLVWQRQPAGEERRRYLRKARPGTNHHRNPRSVRWP